MNNEELAIQTFSIVPEIYQQIFTEAGAKFPDDLVTAIKEDPNQATQLLESDKQLKNAVIKAFDSNKEVILGAVQEMQQNTGMFKKGGKLYYGLKRFQEGGNLQGEVKPKGIKGLLFEATKYPRLDKQPGYVSEYVNAPGDTITTVGGRWTSWQRRTNPKGKTTYQISVGSVPYERTTDPEAIQMLENVHNRFVYPTKQQEGGQLIQKKTTIIGPSYGQKFLGVKRPFISQTVSYLPQGNDTTYTSNGLENFNPTLNDDVTKVKYKTLPQAIKNALGDIINADYSEYNNGTTSPVSAYLKTIDTKYKK